MEFFNSLNLTQIKGGTKLKQGDFGSVLSYSLTDENGQEITSFDTKTAYINLVLDDKIWFTTTTLVDISRVTFRIDKAIPTGLYYLEIKIDDYIFPSDRDSIILIEEGSTPYDLKELVPNYDINMTIKGILSDLSQKGIDINDLKTKMSAIYNNALADHAEVVKARGTEATLGDRLDRLSTNIDSKASATWVEKQLNNILSTTPKASLANFGEIQSTYPNGANGIVIARDSGKWYYWSDSSNAWTEGGTYQSRIIGENEVTADNIDFVQGIQQMLIQKVDGSVWNWNGKIVTFAGVDWARYMPINLLKGNTYYIYNARGYFSHIVSADGTRRIKQLSATDTLVTMEYTATEDSLLYISTNVTKDSKAPKVFNASIDELKSAQVDFDNLPDGYVTLSIPKLTLDVKPEELSFINVIKQLVDERTFTAGKYWTDSWDNTSDADTFGIYPKLYLQAGKTYGLKNVRGFFTHYFDISGQKLKTFATKDVLVSQDFTPEANGYIFITRRISDEPSKVIQGGLSKASLLKNLDYGTSALESTITLLSNDTNSTRFGQKIDGIDSTQKTTVDNLAYMSPVDTWQKTKGFIDSVDVYVKDAGTYNFAIGNIDQNQLIVSPRTFTKELSAGYNSLSLRYENISIFYGEQLFFESKDNTLYAPKGEQNLIQDAQHTTSNAGYSGKIMYRTNNAIPFTYVVAEESVNEKVDDLIRTTEKLDPIVSELEIFKRTPMVVSPNGTKFRLLVDNNGNLSTVSNIPSRVVVFGNSIASHGWLQGIGMAASSKDKDYFTLVKNYILSKNPSAVVERGNGAAWESDPDNRRQTFENKMMLTLKPDTDVVILQFGDNLNTDEKRKNLETDIPNLISWIRNASPKALIYWVGIYYASQDFVDRIKNICEPLDVTFVDIYQFSKDPKYKSYIGAVIDLPDGTKYTVTDPGVASHPGDLGHQAIAGEIIKNFLF